MSSFFPFSTHIPTRTHSRACAHGGGGREGRREKENTKDKGEDGKNMRRISWKASLQNSEIQGEKILKE